MRTFNALIAIAALALVVSVVACGPDSELVASGKAHSCAIEAAKTRLQANPQDSAAQAELADRTGLLKTVIETAEPGDRAQLSAAIQKAVAAGCP